MWLLSSASLDIWLFDGSEVRPRLVYSAKRPGDHERHLRHQCFLREQFYNWQVKNNYNFATSKVKKIQFNHWPFTSACVCSGTPSFDLPTPYFAGISNLNSVPGCKTKTNFIFGFPVPETPLHTFLGPHGNFWADLPNRTGFRPEQQPRPGPKYCSVR